MHIKSQYMPPKEEKLCVDILTAIEEIESFLHGVTEDVFNQSRLQQVAVERELEIIGEALKRLERLNEAAFERIENGRKIIGMRNVLAHGYDVIDYRILWSTVMHDIQPLAEQVRAMIACG